MAVKITINFSDPVDADAFVQHYVNVHVPLVQALPGLRAFEYGRALTNFDGSDARRVLVDLDDLRRRSRHARRLRKPEGKATMADMPNYQAGSMKSVVSEIQ